MQFENYTLLSYNKYNDCIYRYKCNICNFESKKVRNYNIHLQSKNIIKI